MMNGSANVSVNPAPSQFAVSGGGDYCANGPGVGYERQKYTVSGSV